jgi:hypothetical protein
MRDLPSGTVTFLFTDVEGSTKLLHELGAEAYAEALLEHRRVLREAFSARGVASRSIRKVTPSSSPSRRRRVRSRRLPRRSKDSQRVRSGCEWASTRARRTWTRRGT